MEEKIKSYKAKRKLYHDRVIDLYFNYGYGIHYISNIIPLSSSTILKWCSIFAEENGLSMHPKISGRLAKKLAKEAELKRQETPSESQLQAKLDEVEKKLKQAEMRAEAYSHMIDLAEQRFNIPIRKKSGAKQ